MQVVGVHQVGEGEVDEPEGAAERHRGLASGGRERHEALALASCENDRENRGAGHGPSLGGARSAGQGPPAREAPGRYRGGMRVDLLTREYPPHVYGGAGVHVAELATGARGRCSTSACGASMVPATSRGWSGLLLGGRPATRPRRARARNLPMARDCKRRRPSPLPHVVRQHGGPPRRRSARHPARAHGALARTPAAVEGRATRRRVSRLLVDRADAPTRRPPASSP